MPPLASGGKKRVASNESGAWSCCLGRKQTDVAFHQSQWVRVSQEMRCMVKTSGHWFILILMNMPPQVWVKRARKYHFSFILWAFVSFGFWVSIILGDVWKVLCAQGHSLLHKGFIYWLLWRTLHYELVLKSTVYMHVHRLRIIQWLSEGSERI